MSTRNLCIIPGDGIGNEVVAAAVSSVLQVDKNLKIIDAEAGWDTFQKTGESVPPETLDRIRDCGAALFGAVSSPDRKVDGYQSAILKMRQELNLFANIRPVNSDWNPEQPAEKVKLVIVRENSEGLYIQQETGDGEQAVAQRRITRSASHRIGSVAAKIASEYECGKIHVVHKANVLPLTDGLFRDSVIAGIRESGTASQFEIQESLVDSAAYRIVAEPGQFETIVTTNLYGDILSDVAAFWCGGLGRAPSINLGNGIAIAEPVHGSAPDIVGQGIADSTATLLSAALLYRMHWNEPELADRIESLALQNWTATAST